MNEGYNHFHCSVWNTISTTYNINLIPCTTESLNPLTDGIQIKAVLMGGGIECPPSKILENEATESCEGSK